MKPMMRLWLENPQWQVYTLPRRDETGEDVWSWALFGTTLDAPLLEQATFGLAYRAGRKRYLHRPFLHRRAREKDHTNPEAHSGYLAWQADSLGLRPELEFQLHPAFPLVRWRVTWYHEGQKPVHVQRVTLLEVGPLRPMASSRHRWAPGLLPGFLRMRKKPQGQVGALRLHPSPAPLEVVGPPWPWQETPTAYSEKRPYLPPRRARLPQTGEEPPRPEAADHAFTPAWALLWDRQHHRGLAIGLVPPAPNWAAVEVRMNPLHPAVRLLYRPAMTRWEPGHQETTPWAALAFFSRADPAPLTAFWDALGLTGQPETLEAQRRLARAET